MKRDKGFVDLVSIFVFLLMFSIVLVGNFSLISYGRSAIKEEYHEKQVSYLLRGLVEKRIAEIQLSQDFRVNNLNSVLKEIKRVSIDNDNPILVTFIQEYIIPIDLPETGAEIDYYRIKITAKWNEKPLMFSNGSLGKHKEISFNTSVVIRGSI